MCVCQPARVCVCARHLGKLQLKHLLANVSTLRFVCVARECVCKCVRVRAENNGVRTQTLRQWQEVATLHK